MEQIEVDSSDIAKIVIQLEQTITNRFDNIAHLNEKRKCKISRIPI